MHYELENMKEELAGKIAALRAQIAELGIDRDTAEAAAAAAPADDDFLGFLNHCEENRAEMDAFNAYRTLEAYEETLDKPLVKATKRYVITDGDLFSPSGFDIDSLVFIQNDVWIETDRLPRTVGNLFVYDMNLISTAA